MMDNIQQLNQNNFNLQNSNDFLDEDPINSFIDLYDKDNGFDDLFDGLSISEY